MVRSTPLSDDVNQISRTGHRSDWPSTRSTIEQAKIRFATLKTLGNCSVIEERRQEEKKEDIDMKGKSAKQGIAKVSKANGSDAGIGAGPMLT